VISRRTFLKTSAYVALLFGGVTSGNADARRELESQSDCSGFGSGGYGMADMVKVNVQRGLYICRW